MVLLDDFGWNKLGHSCHEEIVPLVPEGVYIICRETVAGETVQGSICKVKIAIFVHPNLKAYRLLGGGKELHTVNQMELSPGLEVVQSRSGRVGQRDTHGR